MSIPTLFVVAAFVLAGLAGVMVFFASLRRVYPGFREWALAQVAASIGLVLLALRGRVSDLASILLANLLLLLHPFLVVRGFRRFYALEPPPRRWGEAGLVGAGVAVVAWFNWVHPDLGIRIVIFSAASALLNLSAAVTPLEAMDGRESRAQRAVSLVFALVVLVYLVRGVNAAFSRPMGDLFADPTLPAQLLVAVTGQVVVAAGLVYLNFDRMGPQLEAKEGWLRLALEAARAGSWEIDLRTGQTSWSSGLWQLHGLAPGSCRPSQEAWLAAVHPEDRPKVEEAVRAAARAGNDLEVEYRVGSGSAERWLMARGRILLDAGARPVRQLGIVVDVSDRKRSEEALRAIERERALREQQRLQEQLIEVQRLEGIGQLAGGVAHDFNNLLTAILSGAQGLRESLDQGSPPLRDDLQAVLDAGARAADLTRQLLAFARRQPFAPAPLDPGALVQELERLVRRLLRESIALRLEIGPDLWFVRADAGQLRQVVLNLAVNARDAMPSGGLLAVEVKNEPLDRRAAEAAGTSGPGDWVRLTVRDTGSGIPPEARPHLFEPFFTTKELHRGSGLGLAVVHGIVKQSQGAVAVESEVGRGTAIHVYLPRCQELPPHVSQPPALSPPIGGREVLLLVEDETLVRQVAERALRQAGYEVRAAADAEQALALDAQEDRLDLLVTDVVMPGMNGRQLADQLQVRRPSLRVLFISGFTRDAIAQHGVIEQGVELLEKPFVAEKLLARVRTILDRPA